MTIENLREKLRNNKELREQFNEEVLERESIMSEKEGEFSNIKTKALEATMNAWLNR